MLAHSILDEALSYLTDMPAFPAGDAQHMPRAQIADAQGVFGADKVGFEPMMLRRGNIS